MNKKLAYGAVAALAAGVSAYAVYRFVKRDRVPASVRRKLPIAKRLPTISDEAGNYDLDGVSFDIEGVIVSGDAVKPAYLS